ncbi:MAG: M20/M25/M40 family metallo-hydrolase [bacterium]
MERIAFLESLSSAFGVSGAEGEVMAILDGQLKKKFAGTRDRLGNRVYTKAGGSESPSILLAAHADEIGFTVQAVHARGYLSFLPVGSWNPLCAVGMPVRVKGKKGLVEGVIGSVPPHHQPKGGGGAVPEWQDLWIDLGARDAQEVRDVFGVRPGDMIVPAVTFRSLADGRTLMGKAWDDRIGCAVMAEALLRLESGKRGHPNSICAVATVQEEVGSRGAMAVADRIEADAALILEGAPADDFPSAADWQAQARMGRGVQIRSYDPSMIASPGLRDFLVGLAEKERIPWQVAVRRSGGTDGGALHKAGQGVPTVVLAVPVRYAHNAVGYIDLGDYEACLRLVCAACRQLSGQVLEAILD